MNKLKYLLLAIVFCLAFTSSAWAGEAITLAEWASDCVSSDPPGTLDFMDPGNPNEAVDIGSTQCWLNRSNKLVIRISNGYPGYQASVYTRILNTSREPVSIDAIRVTGDLNWVLIAITDINGHSLTNQTIDRQSGLEVKVTTRVRKNAAQAGEYRCAVELVAQQAEVAGSLPPAPDSSPTGLSGMSSERVLQPLADLIGRSIFSSAAVDEMADQYQPALEPPLNTSSFPVRMLDLSDSMTAMNFAANNPEGISKDISGLNNLPIQLQAGNGERSVAHTADSPSGSLPEAGKLFLMGAGLSMGGITLLFSRGRREQDAD